jgi:Na+-transporting methylmalonyl-CoA/oxaloacetate decarboxylase gamma subunit
MMKRIFSFIKTEDGSLHVHILGMGALVLVLVFLIFLVDLILPLVKSFDIEEKVEMINRNVYSLEDVEYAAFNVTVQVTDEREARRLFEDMLIENLDLDSQFISDIPYINGPITINDFEVITEDDLPYTINGVEYTRPGIYSSIDVPFKTPFFGIEFTKTLIIPTFVVR